MTFFGNKDGEKRPVEQALEAIKSDYEALQHEIDERNKEIASLKAQIETLKAQGGHTPTSEEPVVTPVPESRPTEEPKPQVTVVDYSAPIAELTAAINALKAQNEEIKMLVGRRDTQDENVRAMHKELERYKADLFAKITQPYLVALMELHRRFYETYSHFDSLDNNNADMGELYTNLMHEFKSAITALSDRTYNDFGVEYFEPKVGDPFDAKTHQVMVVEPTLEPEKDRSVAKIFYGGFRNIDNGRILRPARITCYKYAEPQGDTKPQPESATEPTEA